MACTRPEAPSPTPTSATPAISPRAVAPASPSASADRFERLYHPPEGELFTKKLPPKPGDWLERFKERGQSFLAYQASSPLRPTEERKKIVLQPLGAFEPRDAKLMHTLREHLAIFFALPVEETKPLPLPKKGQRGRDEGGKRWTQHHTTVLLDDVLRQRVPADAIVYVGVLLEDLYPDPSWNFVFGQATLEERVGVHSLARFYPAFWGEKETPEGQRRGLLRSVSVLAHETGHAFGLHHCTEYECVMNGSNSLDELDRQFHELCPVCLRKLAWNIGFDPMDRYGKLRDFYRREGLTELASWIERRMAQLTG